MISLLFVFSVLVLSYLFYKKSTFPTKLISYNPYINYVSYSLRTSFILSLLLPFDISTNLTDLLFTYSVVFLFYFILFFVYTFFTSLKKKDFTSLHKFFFYSSLTIYILIVVFIFVLPSSFILKFYSLTFSTFVYLSLCSFFMKKKPFVFKRLLILALVLYIISLLWSLF